MSTSLTGRISGSAAIADPLTDLEALEALAGSGRYKLAIVSQGDQKSIMRQASMSVINREIDLTILRSSSTPPSIPARSRPRRWRWSRKPRHTSATTTSRSRTRTTCSRSSRPRSAPT